MSSTSTLLKPFDSSWTQAKMRLSSTDIGRSRPPIKANLYRIWRTLLSDQPDKNASYLFDKNTFFTANALNMAIPGGPKFEPLYRDMSTFNDD
ncbi:hypothetical protein B0H13DRAFT_2302394 [Mycena leptocephala]|nr:hypothetical protein B0H13DRAFT_2302394 [Mycena leptocephala]